MEFEPGTSFKYGTGFTIMAAIIQKVTGKSFINVLKERIFNPLEMNNSGLRSLTSIIPNYTETYNIATDGYEIMLPRNPDHMLGSTGLYSTVDDLYKWDRALYSNKLLPKKYIDLLFEKHIAVGRNYYGYGWGINSTNYGDLSKKVVWHTGGGAAIIYRSIEDEHSVIVLNNTRGNNRKEEICNKIMHILYEQAYEFPKKSIADHLQEIIIVDGINKALTEYDNLKELRNTEYNFSENELNILGYKLLGDNQIEDAIQIFKINVKAYPGSSNVYDSLGEAYMNNGENNLAIENYKKSLELDPENGNAKAMLKKL